MALSISWRMSLTQYFPLVLLLWSMVWAVDRSNFKTCEQSGFCKRHRAMAPGNSPYIAIMDSIKIEPTKISLELLNTQNDVRLHLELSGLLENTARLRIKELKPIKERYEPPVGDVLTEEPRQTGVKVLANSNHGLTVGYEENKIVLHYKPFRIDFLADDEPVISVNAQGLLKFEHYREKSPKKPKKQKKKQTVYPDWETTTPMTTTTTTKPTTTTPSPATVTPGNDQEKPPFPLPAEDDDVDAPFPLPTKRGEKPPFPLPRKFRGAAEQPKEGEPTQEGEKQEGQEEKKDGEKQEGEKKDEEKKEEQKPPFPIPEEPDLWEEEFKGHKDTKPFGPSSVGIDLSFTGFEHVYGIPLHADSLALKSTKDTDPYRLFNLDVFEYELNNPMALYGSVPVMYAHNPKRTVGLFWLNAAEMWVDIKNNVADKNFFSKVVQYVQGDQQVPQVDTHWFAESGIIDLFFLLGPTPQRVFQQYSRLTGTTPLPPLFSIAYHQSRWNYNDEQDVTAVDANFDQHDIPMDVIWLDIEHTDGKRYLTWDHMKFPEPDVMINNLTSKGRKLVTIVDPHIKRDDHYQIHKDANANGYYVKNKDGNDYDGWCWPGSSSWLDFVSPAVRDYWASQFATDKYEGSTKDLHVWNDMNEPSVFNGPEVTIHKDAKHFGNWENRDLHNIFAMYVHRATFEGLLKRGENNERPFVLSRGFFAGTQRYGAIWTGDNTGEWGHLKMSIPMVLTLNLAGITFSGADVGGFFKNPDVELLTRWYQAGAYQPFFRAHAHLDTRRREPWLFDDKYKEIIRAAIRARYSLLPYWYTLFYNAERHGGPVAKPLWVDFPKDRSTFGMDQQHLVGSALLVHPVTDAKATGVSVYLPGSSEIWYDTDTYQSHWGSQSIYLPVNLAKIPVFQRGGFIVPRKGRVRRSSILGRHDPYTLIVALDNQGKARGDLYIDDYHTYRYKKYNEFAHRFFDFDGTKLENKNADMNGKYETKSWLERVVICGLKKKPSQIEVGSLLMDAKALDFNYIPQTSLLIIRKPAVNIAEDWTITLK